MDAAIFGHIVADVLGEPIDLRHPPRPGGMSVLRTLRLAPGGNACNVAVAMTKLGATAAAAGLVGQDILGRAIVERLREESVDTSAVFTTDQAQTSATIVAVEPGGERCFFHAPGTNPLLSADIFRRCFDLFRQCAWVQIGYFGLLPEPLIRQLPALLEEFRQLAPGSKIAMDTLNPPGPWELLEPILAQLDLFAPSRTEAAELTGQTRPQDMADRFHQYMRPGSLVGIKLDAEGCYLSDGKRGGLVPGYQVQVIDTTGAGDTWFGALLVALRRGMPLEQAGRFANRAAADCCTAVGASAGVRGFQQTLERMQA
ncbi:carbohydrate kinase family protein [Fontivita pretiosa]|uniref:carbohydrate kinase family protein n=1 Tax=Fontivita pretiosa TaxID=2989684 RepID=UPI003D16FD4F